MSDRNLPMAHWAKDNGYLPASDEALAELCANRELHPNSRERICRLNQIYRQIKATPGALGTEIAGAVDLHFHTVLMHCLDLEDLGLIAVTEDVANGAPKRYF